MSWGQVVDSKLIPYREVCWICVMEELGCWRSFDRGRGDYIRDRSIALCRPANCIVEVLCVTGAAPALGNIERVATIVLSKLSAMLCDGSGARPGNIERVATLQLLGWVLIVSVATTIIWRDLTIKSKTLRLIVHYIIITTVQRTYVQRYWTSRWRSRARRKGLCKQRH
jgi:hypothetical protein